MRFEQYDPEELVDQLENGLKAEIIYTIQLYEKQTGFFRFLGDRLITELNITKEASWDMFNKQFMLKGERDTIHQFSESSDLLREFFALKDFRIGIDSLVENESNYLLARIEYKPIKLSAAMRLLSFFSSRDTVTTDWERRELF